MMIGVIKRYIWVLFFVRMTFGMDDPAFKNIVRVISNNLGFCDVLRLADPSIK
jgi:hypothetical protein